VPHAKVQKYLKLLTILLLSGFTASKKAGNGNFLLILGLAFFNFVFSIDFVRWTQRKGVGKR